MKEKTPYKSHKVVCFQMLDFGTSKSISEVSKSNSGKFIFPQKFQREPFVTINLSQLPGTYSLPSNKYFEYLPIVSTAFKAMYMGTLGYAQMFTKRRFAQSTEVIKQHLQQRFKFYNPSFILNVKKTYTM